MNNVLYVYHNDPDSIIATGLIYEYHKYVYGDSIKTDLFEFEYDEDIPMKDMLKSKNYDHVIVIGFPINWYNLRICRMLAKHRTINSLWFDNHVSSEDFMDFHRTLCKPISESYALRVVLDNFVSLSAMVYSDIWKNGFNINDKFFDMMNAYATENPPYSVPGTLDFVTGLEYSRLNPMTFFMNSNIFNINHYQNWPGKLISKYSNIGISMRQSIVYMNNNTKKEYFRGIIDPSESVPCGLRFKICVINGDYDSNTFVCDTYEKNMLFVSYKFNRWTYEYTLTSNTSDIDCCMIAGALCDYDNFEGNTHRATFRSNHVLFRDETTLRVETKKHLFGDDYDIAVKLKPWWRRFI